MSLHHILPPIVYVAQPKPKKIETRKSRIQTRSAGSVEDSGEFEETYQPIEAGRSTMAGILQSDNLPAIEGSEQKPPSTTGRLSEVTLKAMLLAQETE
jgi:hypothetical protein